MDRQMIKVLFLAFTVLVVSRQSFAATPWNTEGCHTCRLYPLGLGCTSGPGGLGGAHTCYVVDDVCGLEDPCLGVPPKHFEVSIPADTIRAVAEVHPRVAATLWMAAHTNIVASAGSTFWYNSPITADNVEAMIQNGTAALQKASGEPVIYRYYLAQDPATGQWSLLIEPQQASDLDVPFTAFVLELSPVLQVAGIPGVR